MPVNKSIIMVYKSVKRKFNCKMSGPHAPGFYVLTNKSDKTLKCNSQKWQKICEKIAICYSLTKEQSEPKYSLLLGQWQLRGTQHQFAENICSEDYLRSRSIFGTFVVKFFACLPHLGFLNI